MSTSVLCVISKINCKMKSVVLIIAVKSSMFNHGYFGSGQTGSPGFAQPRAYIKSSC